MTDTDLRTRLEQLRARDNDFHLLVGAVAAYLRGKETKP